MTEANPLLTRIEAEVTRRLHARNTAIVGTRPLCVVPFRGYGTRQRLRLNGRVLEQGGAVDVDPADDALDNLSKMARRFTSRVAPGVLVEARYGDVRRVASTNRDGYFELELPLDQPVSVDHTWHPVELKLVDTQTVGPPPAEPEQGLVLVPPASARIGVISDIDDTIMRTRAFDTTRMLRIVLFHNAAERLPFSGVTSFYSALRDGASGDEANPFFYVSSSAWNIYDVMDDFMGLHGLPEGPILLRNMALTRASMFGKGRHDHKLDRITRILETYPTLPFLLIGDSGQRDAALYTRVVERFPGRIAGIYIREVVEDQARGREMQECAARVHAAGSELVVVEDTLEAAEHAAERGWIDVQRLAAIAEEREHDEPDGLGQRLYDAVGERVARGLARLRRD